MEKIKVLVVEDELIIATNLQQRLARLGYLVPAIATTGEEAVQKARDLRPDVILMDIRLGGEMDGIDAADQIKGLYKIPIVYLTAYADAETLSRAKITEPYGYIIKPVEDRELQSNIEIAVYKHRIETQIHQYRHQLNNIITNGSNLIFSVDRYRRLFLWNQAMEQATGVKQKEVLKKSVHECGAFCDSVGFSRYIEDIFNKKKTALSEVHIHGVNGTTLVVSIRHFFLTETSEDDSSIVFLGEDVTAEQERKRNLVKGWGYITFEKPILSPQNSFFLLTKAQYKGLLITRVNSPEMLSGLPLENVRVVFIRESKGDEESITSLDDLLSTIQGFVNGRENTVILLSRVDYLITKYSFERFMLFLYTVNELIAAHHAIFLMQADPVFFTDKQVALISHELHVLPNLNVENVEIDDSLIAILRFIAEQNQTGLIVSFKKIRGRFSIAYSTTTIKLRNLESMGLIFVKKYGRSKAVYLSDKGKLVLAGKPEATNQK
jgi:PAS domain S-box-containing protein